MNRPGGAQSGHRGPTPGRFGAGHGHGLRVARRRQSVPGFAPTAAGVEAVPGVESSGVQGAQISADHRRGMHVRFSGEGENLKT